MRPLAPRAGHVGDDALPQDAALQLRVGDRDVVLGLAEGAGDVKPRLLVASQAGAPGPQPLQGLRGVQDGPEGTVEPPDEHGVDLPLGAVVQQLAPLHPAPQVRRARRIRELRRTRALVALHHGDTCAQTVLHSASGELPARFPGTAVGADLHRALFGHAIR